MRVAAGLACVAVGGALVWLTRSIEPRDPALAARVAEATKRGEVPHEITSVLLDFRGYDTLLEVAVLSLALIGAWGVRVAANTRPSEAEARGGPRGEDDSASLLDGLVDAVAPAALVTGAYLGWAGSHAPGGAFQAGAVLAAGLVLLVVAHRIDPRRSFSALARAAAMTGLWVFLAVALGTAAGGRFFLDYPAGWMKPLVALIEAAVAISIAAILASFFADAYQAGEDDA